MRNIRYMTRYSPSIDIAYMTSRQPYCLDVQVKKKHPVLERYKELWPIGIMLNQHRQLRRAGASRGIIRTDDEIVCLPYGVVEMSYSWSAVRKHANATLSSST